MSAVLQSSGKGKRPAAPVRPSPAAANAAAASFAALTARLDYLDAGRNRAGPQGLPLCRRSPPGPDARQRRALHHPSDRRGIAVRRMEARRAGADGRAAARRDRGLRRHQARADRALRRPGRRTGRRPDQAGQAAVQHPRREPGRVVPQDAAGDGARRAGHPDQAGRPHAQHAHAGRRAARKVGAHLVGDAGDLRADRPPAGLEPDLPRTAGTGLPPSAALAPRRCWARQSPRPATAGAT